MALLEGRPAARPARNESPSVGVRAQSPATSASPVRSMLDIDAPPMRSMLDVVASPAPRSDSREPVPLSPPPSARSLASPTRNPESAYKFEMLPTIEAHSMPKRVSQGGKKNKPRAMSSVYGETELLPSPRDQTRHGSLGGFLGKPKSSSPGPGPGRSQSPGGRKLNTNPLNLMPTPNKYVTDTGRVIDMTSAYRRLSDAALLRSGGGLSSLPSRKGSDPSRGEALAPGGGVRLAIDESGDEAAVESSGDDDTDDSDGDGWGAKKRRGRRRTRADGERTPKSLLAAAEEERQCSPFSGLTGTDDWQAKTYRRRTLCVRCSNRV
jgi:hypothetical protein